MRKEEVNVARMIGSCVSWSVVKIRAPVPSQFIVHVMRDSCPVAPFLNIVTICDNCKCEKYEMGYEKYDL